MSEGEIPKDKTQGEIPQGKARSHGSAIDPRGFRLRTKELGPRSSAQLSYISHFRSRVDKGKGHASKQDPKDSWSWSVENLANMMTRLQIASDHELLSKKLVADLGVSPAGTQSFQDVTQGPPRHTRGQALDFLPPSGPNRRVSRHVKRFAPPRDTCPMPAKESVTYIPLADELGSTVPLHLLTFPPFRGRLKDIYNTNPTVSPSSVPNEDVQVFTVPLDALIPGHLLAPKSFVPLSSQPVKAPPPDVCLGPGVEVAPSEERTCVDHPKLRRRRRRKMGSARHDGSLAMSLCSLAFNNPRFLFSQPVLTEQEPRKAKTKRGSVGKISTAKRWVDGNRAQITRINLIRF